ncbi:PREDICTED: uncharacterized protein LOC107095506 [Cyprinodon variegatus]|uniref:uncharacterized protein LOC107095506 n=1 Tax=Cyprinodon variegatus TaxID=28743 RepID=UPI00074279B4|nr:PREDICTED: uncharacterized protein LOC107095506 [Cyprinodon variegatus]
MRQFDIKTILSPAFLSFKIILAISRLPPYHNECYTEADVISLLKGFGISCKRDQLFIVPQSQMAFFISPNVKEVQHFFQVLPWTNIVFKGSKLFFHVIRGLASMSLFKFYGFLMSFAHPQKQQMTYDTRNIVFFNNMSPSKAKGLPEALKRVVRVRNYLPLLSKAFVHCENASDANRLAVWYMSWKGPSSLNGQQTKKNEMLNSPKELTPAAVAASPLREDISTGASVQRKDPLPIPEGSEGPFWNTTKTSPYVLQTASPYFNIPAYQTVNKKTYMEISQQHLKFPIIMLTGFPNKTYTQEDVALLVWKYFPEQNLHTLYNNVVVLPLQRRAFVFFSSSDDCQRFLRDQNTNPIYLKDFIPKIHLVLEDIHLGSSEVSMFRTLMQWSNIRVPDLKSLEERLLCVEVSGTNQEIAMMVMKKVATLASFASFLPLANRIYIEMAESSGVSKVMQNLSVCKMSEQHEAWRQVGRIERLLSRKERLKECQKTAVNLERDAISVSTEASSLRAPSESPQLACRGMEEEAAARADLPNPSLLPSDKEPESPQFDLASLNKLKSIILQFKHQRESSTLSKQISTEERSDSESSSSSEQTNKEMKNSHSSSLSGDNPEYSKNCKTSNSFSLSANSSSSSSSKPAKPLASSASSSSGRLTRSSSSSAAKTSVETKKSQEKEPKPTETPGRGQRSEVSTAETPNSRLEKEAVVCEEAVKDQSDAKGPFIPTTTSTKRDQTNEDKTASNTPAAAVRTTRQKRKITERDSLVERKDETPTKKKTI